jgi:hypothetical protein
VGTYTVNCAAGSATNYTLAAANFLNAFTVSKAALTYTATGSKTYGSTADNSTAGSFSGFQNGENSGTAAGFVAPSCSSTTGAAALANVGTYTINCTGGLANNYSFASPQTFLNAFTVSKANATIVVTPYNVTYDGNAHTASGTATGVKSESLSGLTLSGTTHTSPGDYTSDPWTFTDVTGNYNNANGTVHDSISYGVCSALVGTGGAILPPINSDGTSVYPRKSGSTIPVKFRVCGASGASISNPAAVFGPSGTNQLVMLNAVRGTITVVNEETIVDIPDNAFRWDASGQQWMFNMATTNLTSGTTYTYRINLAYSPASIPFVVGLK